ncbi:MAG: hypothetical protein E7H33_09900 [Clostridium perfringens]|uniref:hypothetical protein n=1 Tax=Clostridium perfringens TaxID=1502 RepID=UPI00096A7EF9|nr:hypothetical protein [Clostridium perfringens]MDU4051218.1 hypothetical protein [Clostridium perfringens]
MRKYSDEKQYKWLELCEYVKKEILEYDEDMKFPRSLALRLKGLSKGQFIANTNIRPLASYEFEDILLTFKMYKLDILIAIRDKSKFKDENHRINYVMVIIENKLNEVVIKRKKVEKEKSRAESVEIQNNDVKANYIRKTKLKKNDKFKDLW